MQMEQESPCLNAIRFLGSKQPENVDGNAYHFFKICVHQCPSVVNPVSRKFCTSNIFCRISGGPIINC